MSPTPSELLTVQIYTVPRGFHLGYGVLGESLLGGSLVPEWRDILCDATTLRISRGGQPDGVTTSLDVGTMSIQLYNGPDPFNDPGIVPNVPIRVQSVINGTSLPIFTGNVEDVNSSYDKSGNVRVTLTAADAVRAIAATTRYGSNSYNPHGVQHWDTRLIFLSTSLPPGVTRGGIGAIPDRIMQTVVDGDGPTPGLEWVRFGTRPTGMGADAFSAYAGGLWVRTVSQPLSTVVTYLPRTFGVQRPLTGLVVGRLYSVAITMLYEEDDVTTPDDFRTYVLGVAGIGWGIPNVIRPRRGAGPYHSFVLRYDFVATATTHTLQLARDYDGTNSSVARSGDNNWRAETITLFQVHVTGWSPTPVADVNYESSLLNHFQMTCDSVSAYWWVNRYNWVMFEHTLPGSSAMAKFSDVHDASDPLHTCYIDLTMGYDSRNAINTLTLENHGRRDDDRTVLTEGYLVQDTKATYVDTVSRERWGARADTVDVSLPQSAVAARADQMLALASEPLMIVKSITFSALDFPVTASLDLYSRVSVKVRNQLADYLIVGIDHNAEPDAWTTTFTLRKD